MGNDAKDYGLDDKGRYALLKGTPEEKVLAWLNLMKTKDGHFKAGVSSSNWPYFHVSPLPSLHHHSPQAKARQALEEH